MSGNKKIGIALCGFGRAGRIHFNGVRKNCRAQLLYVVDRVEEDPAVKKLIEGKVEEFMMEGVKIVGVQRYETEVLKDPNVDAVIVSTPTNKHEEYVRAALMAKKAVFCEKPIAGNRKSIAECYDLAAELKLPMFCAFNRRFDPGMLSVKEQVQAGKIGKVYQIRTTSRDSPVPSLEYLAISYRIFHDCVVHDMDMVCWVVGETPCGVFAQGTCFDPEIKAIGDVDTAAIILTFPSGVIATIDVSRHSPYGYDQRLEVFGSEGMLQVENVLKEPVKRYGRDSTTAPALQYSFPERYEEAYQAELRLFFDMVKDPSTYCPITKESVLLTSRIADACEQSLKEGRMIKLD